MNKLQFTYLRTTAVSFFALILFYAAPTVAPPTNVTASSFGIVQSVQTAENSGNRTGQLSLRLDF